ncbi:MAG: DUF3368 domain-containing protein [Anaerolineales bacterium]|nr:DUF3368 domain-containing protein [Anaerolineales bacterium]
MSLKAISNTSPLLYLHRIGGIEWLSKLFDSVWLPSAVVDELREGKRKGYDVPNPDEYEWLEIVNPKSMPSEWLSLDLGPGELAAMALALENSSHVVLLDDMLARRTAQVAGLTVWGTLKILLEAKSNKLIKRVEPYINQLSESGMWISDEVRQRILLLADEK